MRTVVVPVFLLERESRLLDSPHSLRVVLRLEGSPASHQFEDGHTKCPQVDPLVVASADKNLRRHVVVGADDGEHVSPLTAQEGFLGDAEVDDLDLLVGFVVEDVLWLDVSVADISAMKISKSGQYLSDYKL